jgi:U4/U6.U5 tri-snRNP-associated protein 1
MAATIALLANKGELVDAERKVGRANDRDVGGIDKTGIRLEHRDNFGRLLNPKEAFRQLSYKFHGKQPGRKKQAKILQAYQDELDAKRTGHGDDHLITMRGLKHEQGRGQAYVRLD